MRRAFTLLAAVALVVATAPMVFAENGPGGPPAWIAELFARSEAPVADEDPDDEDEVADEPVELDPEDFLSQDEDAEGEDTGEDDGEENGEDEGNGEDDGDNGTDDTESADVPAGWVVSTVARCAPTGPGVAGAFDGHRNHGAFVSAAARGDDGFTYGDDTFDLSTLEGAEALCEAILAWDDEAEEDDAEPPEPMGASGDTPDEDNPASSASRGKGAAKGQAERGGGPPAHAGVGAAGAGPDAPGKGPPADRGPGRGKGGRP